MFDPDYKPEIKKPTFPEVKYDYRNMENAGKFRGVGEAGKVGKYYSNSIDAMPPTKKVERVPRDHNG